MFSATDRLVGLPRFSEQEKRKKIITTRKHTEKVSNELLQKKSKRHYSV